MAPWSFNTPLQNGQIVEITAAKEGVSSALTGLTVSWFLTANHNQ
jgi:hypothetical protein